MFVFLLPFFSLGPSDQQLGQAGGSPQRHLRKPRLRGEAKHECGKSGAYSKPQSGFLVGQGRLRPRGSREQPKVTQPKLGLTPVVCLPAQDLSKVLPASQLRAVCPPVFQRARRLTAGTCWPNGVFPGLIKPFAQRIMRLRESLRCPRSHSTSPSSLSPSFR